jgi:hypothetical protein
MMGRRENVARAGASSVFVYLIFDVVSFIVFPLWMNLAF